MPCVINAYTVTVTTQQAVVRKLQGKKPFDGASLVDAFWVMPDAPY